MRSTGSEEHTNTFAVDKRPHSLQKPLHICIIELPFPLLIGIPHPLPTTAGRQACVIPPDCERKAFAATSVLELGACFNDDKTPLSGNGWKPPMRSRRSDIAPRSCQHREEVLALVKLGSRDKIAKGSERQSERHRR